MFIVVLIVFFIDFIFESAYTIEIASLSHKHNIGLNYGEKRILPILLDPSFEKYSYEIKVTHDKYIKAVLLDKEYRILSSPLSVDAGKDVILWVGGKIRKYKEIYLLLEYYSPSTKNIKSSVTLYIMPISSSLVPDRDVTSLLTPSLGYNFNVYLNAYLTPMTSSSYPYSSSIEEDHLSIRPTEIYSEDSVSQYPFVEKGSVSKNLTRNYTSGLVTYNASTLSTLSAENNSSSNYKYEENKLKNSSNFNITYFPTGKAVDISSSINRVYLTYVILVIGIAVLYILWRKV